MNLPFYIALRYFKGNKKNTISRPMVNIAVTSIVISLSFMIIAVAVVTGFKQQIRDKVIGFNGHIQITNFDLNTSYETTPIAFEKINKNALLNIPNVKHIQSFATKAGIVKTKDQIEGIVLKGVGKDYDWTFFKEKIQEGKIISFNDTAKSNEVIISRTLASRLRLKVGDPFVMYFIQQPPRMRKFTIAGIYQTGLEELDKTFILGDIGHVQKLNDWDENQVSGFEVLLHDSDKMEETSELLFDELDVDLNVKTIRDLMPQIFDWLDLQDMNEIIILILMSLVAAINMITALLILILEKSRMIGLLKALGMNNSMVQQIFLNKAAFLIGKGLLWGNVVGVGLCLIQLKFGIFTLDETSYYLKYVPINLSITTIVLLNIATFAVCMLMLLLPARIISKISPVKAIRFS
ncbi:MAG: ABC transporter permease [Bacteroidia bacterium]